MRTYTPQDEARVAALRATGLLHHEIAEQTGIPRRTVSRILGRTPVAEMVTRSTRDQVTAALWEVVAAGTKEALRRIADPRTRAGELASLLKVAAEQHALLSGGVTGRTENLNVETRGPELTWEQTKYLRDFTDALLGNTDDELAEWLVEGGGAALVREANRQADEINAKLVGPGDTT